MSGAPLADLPVRFVGSYPDAGVHLDPPLPEFALIGRSNVGKSSLLNALLGRPGLARVSGTPGKTRLLNVFELPGWYLVDLPGYGWARTSKAERAGFAALLRRYLRGRPTLAGVVWLLDIRHDPSREDVAFQQLLVESGRPTLAVLTKADKLSRAEAGRRVAALAGQLGLPPDQLIPTSARTGAGLADLAQTLLAAVSPPDRLPE